MSLSKDIESATEGEPAFMDSFVWHTPVVCGAVDVVRFTRNGLLIGGTCRTLMRLVSLMRLLSHPAKLAPCAWGWQCPAGSAVQLNYRNKET